MSELKAFKAPNHKLNYKAVKKVFIAGTGAVGGALIKQLCNIQENRNLKLIGLCNSGNVKWYSNDIGGSFADDLRSAPKKNWDEIVSKLASNKSESVIFVDSTGSPEVAALYPELLQNGIHVVTPSKLANTQSQEYFDELQNLAAQYNTQFLYETNVGAGLPIIKTIKNLIDSGDEILEISGVLSGTMTYLFSELDKGELFSKSVIKARTLGYAEPDPRDDLSGEDVARKFLILARICGCKLERYEINVESLIPDSLKDTDSVTFLEKLPEHDSEWRSKVSDAVSDGKKLRYTGLLKDGKIKIGVEAVDQSSPIGRLNGTNNLITIKTGRYNHQPLIIQGPGAGKNVTAAGILSDILSIE